MLVRLALATLVSASAPAAAAGAEPSLDIPAQRLDSALSAFARQSGVQVLYDTYLIGERRAPAIKGTLPPAVALRLLLGHSGLVARFIAANSAVIAPAPSQLTLAPLKVTAAPMIGRDDRPLRAYATAVQANIVDVMRHDDVLSVGGYVVRLRLWIEPSGRVRRVERLPASGDSASFDRLHDLLGTVDLPPPPDTLPQPLRLEFRASPVSRRDDCQQTATFTVSTGSPVGGAPDDMCRGHGVQHIEGRPG